ncbi:MAG: hypothetical protein NC920_03485 [Candidatus Omnitrophica bacterium]|nr:hypothetical protein [Candidatus Omnitrophota bacterium]MCM8798532.1 hypothetical protein [Candidatus Omnitrophota bacterium]
MIEDKEKRYPLEGEFKIEKNELWFFPYPRSPFIRKFGLPRRMHFSGNWRLNPEHNLLLVLRKTDYQYAGDVLEIKGKIFAVEPEELFFQARFKSGPEGESIVLLRLGGRWQADKFNRLNFLVTHKKEEDILLFSLGWRVTENHQIVYTYTKKDLISGRREREYLEFKGFWEIVDKHHLRYVVDFEKNSLFQFKGFWEIPEKQGKKGEIKCRIGVGLKKGKQENIFLLSGEWKVKRKNILSFSIDYGKGDLWEIVFRAEAKLDKDKGLVFLLRDRKNAPLGVEIKFEKKFLSANRKFFLQLSASEKEKLLAGGMVFRW